MNNKEKLDKIIEGIGNLHPDIIAKIYSIDDDYVSKCKPKILCSFITNEILKNTKPVNKSSLEYWLKRGWPEKEAKIKSKEIKDKQKLKRTKSTSPYTINFWVERGYSEQEAEYKRNSKRPIRKEYWIEKGYPEQEAIKLAKNTKDRNNKNGAKKSSLRPIEELRKNSTACIEYYLEKGYSEQEAIVLIKERQATGRLDRFIQRYGEVEGLHKWQTRQIKWQETLKNKPKEEIEKINKCKNSIKLKFFNDVEHCISDLGKIRNIKLYRNIEEYLEKFKDDIKKYPYIVYYPIEKIMDKIPNIQKEIFNNDLYELEKRILNLLKPKEKYLIIKGNKQAYRKWETEGLLRSSYEIYFYDKFTTSHKDKK
jgi:hypothetical protein